MNPLHIFTTATFAVTILVTSVGCASPKKKETTPGFPVPSTPMVLATPKAEEYGPDLYGPLPTTPTNPDQIVVIFGPGMTQGYSCVGVLKTLHEMKVSIRAIYASEACALISALYLTQPTLSQMDWALMQFGEDALFHSGSRLQLGSAEGRLEQKLKTVFGEKQIEELKTKLSIPLLDSESGQVQIFQKGKLREVLRAALSTSNGLAPGKNEGRSFVSARAKLAYPYVQARKEEGYPIFLFETEKLVSTSRAEVEKLNGNVVAIKVQGISDQDFKKRNEAIYLGKRATLEAKSRILERLGRTE